jgi:hypothetical protein
MSKINDFFIVLIQQQHRELSWITTKQKRRKERKKDGKKESYFCFEVCRRGDKGGSLMQAQGVPFAFYLCVCVCV